MGLKDTEDNSEKTIRMWKIDQNTPKELDKTMIPLEERLEDWIEADISMISDDLLVIGRQVNTDYRGFIDLLCIDRDGDLVIVELKRDKIPRDITSQVIDYASWVKDLSAEEVINIANSYLSSRNIDTVFEDYFFEHFNLDLPETINNDHSMLVVGSNIDPSTKRIISYLSEHGIGINAFTFNYFKRESDEFIASTYLIEPSRAEVSRTRRKQVTGAWYPYYEKIAKGVIEKIGSEWTVRTRNSFLAIYKDRWTEITDPKKQMSPIHYEFNNPPNKLSIYIHVEDFRGKEVYDKIKKELSTTKIVEYNNIDLSKKQAIYKKEIINKIDQENIEKDVEKAVKEMVKLIEETAHFIDEALNNLSSF